MTVSIGRRAATALGIGVAVAVAAAPAVAQDPAPAPAPAPLSADAVAPGVSIAGVDVGGMSRADARLEVIRRHVQPRLRPIVALHRGVRVGVHPRVVRYTADVDYALDAAMLFGRSRDVPAQGFDVPLRESVDAVRVRRVIEHVVARYDVEPADAAFSLRGTTPVVRKPRLGIAVDVDRAANALAAAVVKRPRNIVRMPSRRVRPDVTTLPPAIIIDRGNFRLTLWRHGRANQTYPIAVGTSSHPTPAGNFSVITKQMHPTWFPPSSPWAAGLGPVPPGPSNPLGTRWIGTSAPAIGIHGTPVPSSIGTRASHGCIRMYIRDVERLYSQVAVGTRVYIR